MSFNVINQEPYLRTSRTFPQDSQALSVELSKSYLDIANMVNARSIGIYATLPSVTGNIWYLRGGGQKNQTIRQVYTFTGGTNPINIQHNINFNNIAGIVLIQGTFVDSSDPNNLKWYPLPFVNVAAANSQVSISLDKTNIIITSGAGAPPMVSSGFCVIEWMSNP